MKKFEYAVIKGGRAHGVGEVINVRYSDLSRNDEYSSVTALLDEAGKEGWELINIHWFDSICFNVTFKRETTE